MLNKLYCRRQVSHGVSFIVIVIVMVARGGNELVSRLPSS